MCINYFIYKYLTSVKYTNVVEKFDTHDAENNLNEELHLSPRGKTNVSLKGSLVQ